MYVTYRSCCFLDLVQEAFRQLKFECCEMVAFRVCGARQNFNVFSLYCKADLDDRIYERFLTSLDAVLSDDVSDSFLFVPYLNGHRQEWLGSTTKNPHGVAASIVRLSMVTISWLSARPRHVVELLSS